MGAVVGQAKTRHQLLSKMARKICLWSSPRNVSTALMYSFAQRADTKVYDEPLYAHFLKDTNAQRPDRDDTLAQMENDGSRVVNELILAEHDCEVVFFKNIANHIISLDKGFLSNVVNVILIRDPKEMLLSYTKVIDQPSMLDIAMGFQENLFKHLKENGLPVVVLDSKQLLLNPEKVLKNLCAACNISWDPSMLSWEAGPRKEDGVWAKYWYHGVHKSTGFKAYSPKEGELAPHLIPLYEQCLPIYEYLSCHSLLA